MLNGSFTVLDVVIVVLRLEVLLTVFSLLLKCPVAIDKCVIRCWNEDNSFLLRFFPKITRQMLLLFSHQGAKLLLERKSSEQKRETKVLCLPDSPILHPKKY